METNKKSRNLSDLKVNHPHCDLFLLFYVQLLQDDLAIF